MSKKIIQVVLKENIQKLGKSNDVVKVATGYARNFLIPNKMASVATVGMLNQQKLYAAIKEKKIIFAKENARKTQQLLEEIQKFSISKKTGDGETIFGSVTEKEISQIIKNTTNVDIDKQNILIPEIKTIGLYNIEIKLFNQVTANIQLQVLPESN
uniref:Large ribosomal subunit protein bL9c n=1 Tax=Porphyra purpurea TaxID=2787 RepID=RK9_PORPU|nr:ribosomal protein L9 [Porphyra purpurea]P51334.1 RecName: Full=Large ribosomal subunit protein bL9c; AltName: Full=50S ribosomal protein L9, chloroplastic [Porphyra purpurea]AAC08220.1 50S ribosomal protein L9 [Porphyra purpurea]